MFKVYGSIILPLILFAAQWQSLDGPPAGRADDMSMGYDPQIPAWVIYAADRTHKLYKSVNEGEFWDSIYLDTNIVNPVCVICDPNDAQVVYIGKNDQTPVWKSDDGGVNWYPRSYGITNTQPLCFAMDPYDSRIVYLGCKKLGDRSVLFRTTNGGWSWTALKLRGFDVNDILVIDLPYEGIILFLATDKGILKGRYYEEFRLIKSGNFSKIFFNKKMKKIFAKSGDKIWESRDGKNWEVYGGEDGVDLFGLEYIITERRR